MKPFACISIMIQRRAAPCGADGPQTAAALLRRTARSVNAPLGSPSNINVIYTSLKSTFSAQQFPRWQCGSIFICLAAVAYQKCDLTQNSLKIWTYSSSRSSKVDDLGTNRKRICDFLLVVNSNFGPTCILHRFWDTATYLLKNAFFHTPLLFGAPAPYLPLEFRGEVKRQKTRVMGLLCGEGCVILPSTVFDRSTRVTDRRTDGQTDKQTDGR